MTLDEAIAHALEVAEQNEFETRIYDELNRPGDEEYRNNSCQCAAEHKQLVEWLTELKELREKYREVVMEGEILNADYTEQVALNEQYKKREEQYKRLLKSAIDEWNLVCEWGNCGEYCGWFKNGKCTQEWSNKAEALKLIGETNEP